MSQKTGRSEPDDAALQSIRDHFVDEELTLGVGQAFVEASIQRLRSEEPNQANVSLCERWVRESMERGVRLIARYSESPTERVFLNALLMGFIQRDPMGFSITGPCSDVLTDLRTQRKMHDEAVKRFREYAARTGDVTGEKLEAMMAEDVEAGALSAQERDHFLTHALLYEQIGFWDAFHLMMQPSFPTLAGDGQTRRADLLAWIPRNDRFQVVVECEGYGYRSSEDAAVADRQSDGLLQLQGFRVIRYAETAIRENPVAVSADLIERLHRLRDELSEEPAQAGPRH